jgi:hypothetical protein
MNCQDVKACLGSAADNELPNPEAALVADHLTHCPDCQSDWDKIIVVQEGIQEILKSTKPSADFEKRILWALDKEEKASKSKQKKWLVMGIAAAFALTIAAASTFKQQYKNIDIAGSNLPAINVSELVTSTSHHSTGEEGKEFLVSYLGKGAPQTPKLELETGFKPQEKTLGSFKISGSDLIKTGGQSLIRVCYTNPEKDYCIDCYQAAEGRLALKESVVEKIAGKEIRVAALGEQSAVLTSYNGVDLLYVSPMPKDELARLVASSS